MNCSDCRFGRESGESLQCGLNPPVIVGELVDHNLTLDERKGRNSCMDELLSHSSRLPYVRENGLCSSHMTGAKKAKG